MAKKKSTVTISVSIIDNGTARGKRGIFMIDQVEQMHKFVDELVTLKPKEKSVGKKTSRPRAKKSA